MVYLVINFKKGTGKELGDCKCGAQTPESGDMEVGRWVVVDTEYHHHVLRMVVCVLWLTFKMVGFWFIS